MTLDRYLAALAELGLLPGATIEDVRRAWKALFREVHPDLYPDDAEKLERAKELNNAHDELEAISEAGLLGRYATQAEYDRRTGGGSRSRASGMLLDIFVIVAPAGFGKTYSWAKAQRPTRRGSGITAHVPQRVHVILASPTVDLIDQTFEMLTLNGVDYATALHSSNTKGGVHRNVAHYHIMAQHRDDDAILLISHAEILHHPLPPNPEEWDLVFDEMPECISFLSIDAPFSHRHITRYIDAQPERAGLYRLVPKDTPSMTRLIRMAGNRNPHDGALEYFKPMAAAIVSGHTLLVPQVQWDDLVSDDYPARVGGHIDVLLIVPPIWFAQYRSVTMMGARVHSHLTSLVWSRLWKVAFTEDDRFRLPKRHGRTQSRLLTIHYIFNERVSRGFLATRAGSGGSLFSAACESVAKFYDGADFLWSAPRPGDDREHGVDDRFWKKRGAFRPSLRLPGKTHGLNKLEFMTVNNVALMSVVQFSPNQFELLHTLGLSDDQANKAMSFDVVYQDMMRCSLRQDRDGMPPRIPVRDLNHAVHVTVMDKATAEDIAAEFTGCKVMPYPAELVPQPLPNKRGPRASGTAKSSTERSRERRARMAIFRQEQEDRKNEAA